MTSSKWKAILASGVVLGFFSTQVYVQAKLDERAANREPAASTAGEPNVFGKVVTSGTETVMIDGNSVGRGTTVFSGSFIRTGDSVGAAIMLGRLGKVEAAPTTTFRILFDPKKVEVELGQGCVSLTTNEGVSGAVKSPDGSIERIGPEKRSSIDVCTEESAAALVPDSRVADPIFRQPVSSGLDPLFFAIGKGSLFAGGTTYLLTRDPRPSAASPFAP